MKTFPISAAMTCGKKIVLASALATLLGLEARAQFSPGNLAVLRISNVLTNVPYKQGQIFVDQFSPTNPGAPTFTVAIPTNGSEPLIADGQAATEGAMSRAADHSSLAIIGYQAALGSIAGKPPDSTGPRGIGLINIPGTYVLEEANTALFGGSAPTNPRGIATDGTNNYWAGGGTGGTLYVAGSAAPITINNQAPAIACQKMINGVLYFSTQSPVGIYNFVDFNGNLVPFPTGTVFANLVLAPSNPSGGNIGGFDLNSASNICYVADTALGVLKYTNGLAGWQLAYAFGTGDPGRGCFGLAVDFSGASPVIYATTTDTNSLGYWNTNRLIRIVDTNSNATFTTLATAPTDDVFKAVDFTPDNLPFILAQPQSVTANPGGDATLSVTASSTTPVNYTWLKNGAPIGGNDSAAIEFNSVTDAAQGNYQVIITNQYGSVTSAVATLTLNSLTPTIITQPESQTNFYDSSVELMVAVSGVPPLSFQWYQNNSPLSDGGDFSGSGTNALTIDPAKPGDAGDYKVIIANSHGSVTSAVVTVDLVAEAPVITNQPASTTLLVGGTYTLTAGASGTSVSSDPLVYLWYQNGSLLGGGPDFTGLGTPSLTISPAQTNDSGGYVIVVTNSAGSATSQVASVSVVLPPSPSYISYTTAGANYSQNFDTLPNPGLTSVAAGNPVTIGGITYSLDNPWDFAFPVLPSGNGGLGLSAMAGWYGWVQAAGFNRFGANCGDSTTGGIISFGLTNSLAAGTNRAIGLLTTGNTEYAAFAALFVNGTTNTLKYVNLSYTGEIWRQSNLPKTLEFYYIIDPAGTDSTLTGAMTLANSTVFLPALDVNLPTDPTDAGGAPVDGTQAMNQVSLAVSNQAITNWPPGAALWLIWEDAATTGKSQGLAIDNLSFAASPQPAMAVAPSLAIQAAGTNVMISWPVSGAGFILQQSASVSQSSGWSAVSQGVVVTGASNTVTVPAAATATYYRLKN
jgi:hypothetical protein